MKITRIPVGALAANCYIIETESKNAAAVDAGGDFEKLKKYLDDNGLTLKKILLTHGHFDHIGAVAQLSLEYNAEVFIHEDDAVMLTDRRESLADAAGGMPHTDVEKYTTLKDGDTVTLDELSFEVIHTPGHTRGGVCYKCGNSLFTGDTLFKMSMGRTDFPGGSASQLFDSLKRLSSLEGDYDVYPGHNEPTTLDYERKYNAYLKGNPYEDFI
ncbi:MAG: MBL fold metallo-hydrolase [Oscillospiraceae bacterium]|nr:MBL fold metallo-hydrolase [Oscillospiraceae bacterium]